MKVKKKGWKLKLILLLVVVIISYLIHLSSPKINKDSENRIIQPTALIDKERGFVLFFLEKGIELSKAAEFFSVSKEEIEDTTKRFKKEIPNGAAAVPIK